MSIEDLQAIQDARHDRDVAISLAETADRDGWDRKVIDQAIEQFADKDQPFSSNTLRPLLPEVRPALLGARFLAAARSGRIRRVGYEPSTQKTTHGHPVAVWVGVNQLNPSGDT